jgi:RNA polymerase sigma-70 factor, ECF subfamily
MQYDEAFIAKLRLGDRKCFEKLFLNTYESLCEYSASITNCPEDAEGAVQDVFTSLWENRLTLDKVINIRAFLFKSVKNRSLDIQQHKKIREKYQDTILAMYKNAALSSDVSTGYLIKRVKEEVEKLPDKCREVYLLHRRDGLTYTEIAEVLAIPKKTVESRMTKALKTLRERLKNENDLKLIPLLAILAIG